MRRPKITAWLSAIAVILNANCVSADKEVETVARKDSVLFQASFTGSELDLTRRWHLEGKGKAQIDN
jgi:hypothetical protein